MFSNVPDMESLPPMAAVSSSTCAFNAPSNAPNGNPHLSGSVYICPKYSWKDIHACFAEPPAATIFESAEITDSWAPINGFASISYGSKPHDMMEEVVVVPLSTGIRAAIA